MKQAEVVDTYPDFLDYWEQAQNLSIGAMIEAWADQYMSPHPELMKLQTEDYRSQDIDWKEISGERVFPNLASRLPTMAQARRILLDIIPTIHAQAQLAFNADLDAIYLIYVGIGCGAGWATTYQGKPAVLLGLENIAECGWLDVGSLSGLTAHELGHLLHNLWRQESGMPPMEGSWWQLYREGFAQRCEHLILGKETWHMADHSGQDGWLGWCSANLGRLSGLFLEAVDENQSTREFFGSWYEIEGHSQTGYFLGHELMRYLGSGVDIMDIARLANPEARLRPVLERFAAQEG